MRSLKIFSLFFSLLFSVNLNGEKINSPYELLSDYIQKYISDYSFTPQEYMIKKMETDVVRIFAQRFERIKSIMEEIIESKASSEFIRISSFFADKMKPFAEREDMRREELIAALQRYIKTFPNSPMTPYAILRYAELLYEKISYEYIASYEKAVLEGKPPPKKDFSPVVKIYEDFLKEYPNFPRKDAVLYLAGYVLDEMGESFDAVEKYFAPLARIRISSFAPEAAMRCGEFWFDAGDLDKAEEFYIIVLDFPSHPLYSKALFKLAWTYYRKGEYDLAVDYFTEAISAMREEDKRTGLVQESIDYMIASVVELGGFNALGKELQTKIVGAIQKAYGINPSNVMQFVLESEGKTYFEQGRYQEAILSYKSVIDKFYKHPRSIISAFGIYESLKKLGNIDQASDWIIKIAQRWGPKSEWAQLNPSEYRKNAKRIETQLAEVAKYFHSKGYLDKAEKSYLLFLDLFPASEFSAEVQYLLGELYFQKKDYLKAYKYYKANVENTVVKQNKFLIDSAWAMVISADKALQSGVKEAAELLKEASFMFERLFPMDRRVPIALYKAAQVLASEGKTEDALFILQKIVQRYPGSEVVADSIMEIIKIYVQMGDLEKTLSLVLEARKRKDILKDEDIAYLNDLGAKALFKIAERYEKDKKYDQAVSKYIEVVNLFPNSDLVDNSFYNIIMIKYEGKAFNDVITYSKIFIDRFPDSEFLFDVKYVRAVALANLFYFDEALSTYKDIISTLEKKKENLKDIEREIFKNSIKSVMNINLGLGKYEEAAFWTLKYYQEFGVQEENPESLILSAADLYYQAGKYEKAISLLEEFINTVRKKNKERYNPDIIFALHRISKIRKIQIESGEKKYLKEYEKLLSEIIKGSEEVEDKSKIIEAYSEALFYFAKKKFDEYKKIRFSKTDKKKQLKRKLKIKAKMSKELQEEFSKIAKLGDPYWSFAALYYTAEIYREFANMLIEAPIPREIEKIRDPEEREMAIMIYREELEKQAFPLEDSALKILSSSVEKIKELGIRNEWTAAIFKSLKTLDPLSPVEIEDDKIANTDLFVSLRAEKIPKVEEEVQTFAIAFAGQKIDVYSMVEFEKLKEYLNYSVIGEIFKPKFIYYNGEKYEDIYIGENIRN